MKLSTLSAILIRGVVPALLVPALACPPNLAAQAQTDDHLVSPEAMQQQVHLSAAQRAEDVAAVTAFLSTPEAAQAMHDAHVDAKQVRTAIPTLSDSELKDLAARSADAQKKIAAGGLGSLAITLIILGVILIIVVAIVH